MNKQTTSNKQNQIQLHILEQYSKYGKQLEEILKIKQTIKQTHTHKVKTIEKKILKTQQQQQQQK